MKRITEHQRTLLVVNGIWILSCLTFLVFVLVFYKIFDFQLRNVVIYREDVSINYTIKNESNQTIQQVSIVGGKEEEDPILTLKSIEPQETVGGGVKKFGSSTNYHALWLRYDFQNQWKYVYLTSEYGPYHPIILTVTDIDSEGNLHGKLISGEWGDEKEIKVLQQKYHL